MSGLSRKTVENTLREPQTLHLRYGIILTDYKMKRYIIARADTLDRPLVIIREKIDDPDYMWSERYLMSRGALTPQQADVILDELKKDDMRKARSLLKKNIADKGFISADGPVELDDMIPDDWYDCWKEMEGEITVWRDLPGYTETDVVEQILF